MYEEDFQQSGAGWWIRLIGCIVYIAIIVAYAWQTLELVSWLIPDDNEFMRGVTVFVCDGCATGYAMAEMFYRFRLRRTKDLTFGMWIVTFIFSTAATVIQMYLGSTHTIPHAIDPSIIVVAYGIIITAFVVNIIAITVIIRMEYGASQPKLVYMDDLRKKAIARPTGRVVEAKPAQKRVAAPAPRKAVAAPKPVVRIARASVAQTVTTEEIEDQAAEVEEESEEEAAYLDELASEEVEEPGQDTEEVDVIDDQPGPHGIDEEEASESYVPLSQRLANAVDALTGSPRKLRRR